MTDPIAHMEEVATENETSLLEWETPEAMSLSVTHTYNGGTVNGPMDGTNAYT